jgi:hypothetical protein
MYQIAFVCNSYANNIGVRLARWERDSNSERATQKGSTRYECMCASVRSSDYWTFVCAMRIDVMSYINTPSESMAYYKEDMDSIFG